MAARKSTRFDRKPTRREVEAARRKLAADEALPPEPDDPELAEVLSDVMLSVRYAMDVAITVCEALKQGNTTEEVCAETTLRRGCADELSRQLRELEKAIKGVCIAGGSRLVINSNRLATSGDSRSPVQS